VGVGGLSNEKVKKVSTEEREILNSRKGRTGESGVIRKTRSYTKHLELTGIKEKGTPTPFGHCTRRAHNLREVGGLHKQEMKGQVPNRTWLTNPAKTSLQDEQELWWGKSLNRVGHHSQAGRKEGVLKKNVVTFWKRKPRGGQKDWGVGGGGNAGRTGKKKRETSIKPRTNRPLQNPPFASVKIKKELLF